ncbi:hypothetical protein Hrd1104_11485 [Halorhabdus sp. CBA1104]|uniref:hypothetical protein n=1 Tax=unclassified Halorhabdus TaxID=2621901 RepID=UPI0012B21A5A|nr:MULTISPECIES: hypothetical protein [unclassified Halorhabdus]QGN07861.1 hypothetical protein Hrd1104_11485 [Halorhabdus sp. CBA1104]
MDVRNAVEADANGLAALADSPVDVMRNLVHDRTVRVAIANDAEAAENSPAADSAETPGTSPEQDETPSLVGFVSFDVRGETVYVTQIGGTEPACTRLLEEPIGFARREDMDVELLVPEEEAAVRRAVEAAAFTAVGDGPRFLGQSTTRYRLDPGE